MVPTTWISLPLLAMASLAVGSFGELPRRQPPDKPPYLPYCNYSEDFLSNDSSLSRQLSFADYVFSAKVISKVSIDQENRSASFVVFVKRFFKKTRLAGNRHELRLLQKLREGEGVECRQLVRYRYIAIFLAKKPEGHEDADVVLTASPITVTVENLDRVNRVIKKGTLNEETGFNNVAHKSRQQIIEEPCEKTFCSWGAHCVTSSEGKALCQCPTHCRPITEAVCGTDGKTYLNPCELRVTSCKTRQSTVIKHHGACEINDPCRDKQCGFGARCVPSPDGRDAACQCAESCPSYGDHSTSHPICGSDGVDYDDHCQLNKAACTTKTNITVKFYGKCDPCAGIECPEPEICQLDENRSPVCRCGDTCPLEFIPVCGSDGKTYSNECVLRQETCRSRKNIHIIYRGRCSSGVNPCTSVRCTLGEECSINKFGIARCECSPECEPIMRPVCSKDGRTYSSECELKRSACIARTTIEVAYAGVCGEMGPCSNHECKYGATCVERAGMPSCECPSCPAEFQPVCGSDGISYGNECKLRLEACKHHREIRVLYDGSCNGCENKKCDFYATCDTNGATEGRCICPHTCQDTALDKEAVCGTDNVTYKNECDLRIASCKTKKHIQILYKGTCDLCQGVNCKYGARCEAGECVCPSDCEESTEEAVCASNMSTFINECELQKASCSQSTELARLSVLFYGNCSERFPVTGALTTLSSSAIVKSGKPDVQPTAATPDRSTVLMEVDPSVAEREACRDIHCDFEATCELGPDNFPRCTCQFDCANADLLGNFKPVCASDLRLYSSLCAMKMEACQRQEELRLRPLDLCQGMEVKPCNGEKPIIDPITGKELDCGNGPNRKDCPSGSYCHQTTRFSRCCHKDQSILQQKSCADSWFGCCPDGKTPAQGALFAGCPSLCACNKLGSYSDTCDPETQQCQCRPGVGGEKCDRCLPGYWGLPKISYGHLGCIPCGCSMFGSVREDCEQMTGRCVCKPGIQGQKCTVCTSHNKILSPNGCESPEVLNMPRTSCKNLTCHFGAVCVERNRIATCECNTECLERNDIQFVCGSDGQTYSSACQLRMVACKLQKDIVVQAFGSCKDDLIPGTDWPVRRYTPLQFTQPDEGNSPLSKSTRHLAPDLRYYYEKNRSPVVPVRYSVPDMLGKSSTEHQLSVPDSFYNTLGRNFAAAYRPTPATVRVVTALLGDLCSEESDCVIRYSSCIDGACTCLPEYLESSDRQKCIIVEFNTTEELGACTSSPCYHGSTCVDLPSYTFACICSENTTGFLCESKIFIKQYKIPFFNGKSYVRLKPLKAYHKLSLEIEFKTYSENGILLYNQQKDDGLGDFVSLAIVNGFMEFKYNLGNGPVVISSLDKLEMNKFHKVVIKRYHRDGMLRLDNNEDVAGQSRGSLRALDLLEEAYIGYIPTNITRIYKNIGTERGFQGCIKKLKIGRHIVELHENRDDIVISVKGVHECGENPCSHSPCKNGGICYPIDSESFTCECSSLFIGKLCEIVNDPCLSNPCRGKSTCSSLNGKYFCKCPIGRTGKACDMVDLHIDHVSIPEFEGTSFIKLPKLEDVGKSFFIEISFLSRSKDGLIFYNGQMRNGKGDFISLNLVAGYIQFRYNLGSGIANITSKERITLGRWYWVKLIRKGREGLLQLDNSTLIRGYSGPPLTELNLELPFYIGSVFSWLEIHKLSGAHKSFQGAIQKLIVNKQQMLPLSLTIEDCLPDHTYKPKCAFNVSAYVGPPCYSNKTPCLNGGLCLPNHNDYHCQCQSRYEGKHCEIVKESIKAAVKFNGSTFLQYKNRGYKSNDTLDNYTVSSNYMIDDDIDVTYEDLNLELLYVEDTDEVDYNDFDDYEGRKGEHKNRYEFKLRTSMADGLLLWRSKSNTLSEDYFAIAIINGYPEISYNLGKEETFWAIRSKTKIDDGEWHTLEIKRKKKVGFISVDNELPIKGISSNGAVSLNTSSKLWIGGAPSLPTGLPLSYYQGYKGCIKYVVTNNRALNLLKHSHTSNIEFCHDNEI